MPNCARGFGKYSCMHTRANSNGRQAIPGARDRLCLYRWLLVCFFVIPTPRPLVHCHAELPDSGCQVEAFSRHLQLYHAQTDVDYGLPHIHWTYGPHQDCLPTSAASDSLVLIAPDGQRPHVSVSERTSLAAADWLASQPLDAQHVCHRNYRQIVPGLAASFQTLFCVWHC